MPTSSRWALLLSLVPVVASAHPKGFHKRTVVTVSARAVDALVTLDVDSGKRSSLLRAMADADGDGSLSDEEAAALKQKLVSVALGPLRIELSGYAATLEERESKLSLRGDRRPSDEGLSVAVLCRASLPAEVTPGMTLSLRDESPDRSHVEVQVFQAVAPGGREEAAVRRELSPGERLKVRLGRLLVADAG